MNRLAPRSDTLRSNHEAAEQNRRLFAQAGALVILVTSAPGAGKTSLLEATVRGLQGRYRLGVLQGNLQSDSDLQKIRVLGAPSFRIHTGTACHLDARMIAQALTEFSVQELELLFIENVRNLICPVFYDLGESLRVIVCCATQGPEHPKKYPAIFDKADLVILSKSDLVNSNGAELQDLESNVREVNPKATVLPISCKTGDGLDLWLEWVRQAMITGALWAQRRS